MAVVDVGLLRQALAPLGAVLLRRIVKGAADPDNVVRGVVHGRHFRISGSRLVPAGDYISRKLVVVAGKELKELRVNKEFFASKLSLLQHAYFD